MSALPISLRSKATEQRYQDDKKAGLSSDIANVPPKEIKGLSKIVKNRYEIWIEDDGMALTPHQLADLLADTLKKSVKSKSGGK